MIEILSPELGVDTTTKVREYQALASIQEYVLIDSRKPWVAVNRRGAEGLFVVETEHVAGTVRFASIDYVFDIDALYSGISMAISS